MAEVVEPLRVVLEQLMAGASRRTKRVARNRVIQEDAWTAERVRAWRAAQDLMAQAVPLYHPRPGCVVLMLPDASDFHWGSFFTQVPEEDFRNGTAPREVVHFDFLYVGSSGSEGSEGLPEEDGFRYILVIMDDLSNFVSLEPAEACTVEVTAKHLLNWCKTMRVPRVSRSSGRGYRPRDPQYSLQR